MTKINCSLDECIHCADGICTKDEITLDNYHMCDGGCDDGWEFQKNPDEDDDKYEGKLPNCPLVELPEIIRCKDCVNRCTNDCPMFFEEWIEWEEDGYIERDNIGHDHTEDNYFCSQGVMREDG